MPNFMKALLSRRQIVVTLHIRENNLILFDTHLFDCVKNG